MSKKDKRRKPRHDPSGEGGGGGGVMRSLRGGFKGALVQDAGRRARNPMRKARDVLFWVLLLALVVFFAYRRFR